MPTEPAPPRPRRRALAFALLLSVVLAVACGALAVTGRRAVADGRQLLDEGRPREAAARFAPHVSNPFVRNAARAGLAVSRVAAGQATDVPADVAADARRLVDLPALAERAMEQSQWPAAEALADVVGLAARVRQARGWHEAGARTIVLDRNGLPLGWLGAGGAFHGDPADLLPTAALARAARGARAVRVTIDLELARLARAAIGDHRGSIVLLDATTGEILAAVSDARTLAEEGGTPAFEQRREPASISKLMTSTATYRAGLDADREVARMTCPGHARYGARELWCTFPAGPLRGLGHALAVSCNVAFANLGLRLGLPALVDELRRFGFDRPGDVVQWGRVVDARPEMLPDLSIGLEATDITPVHAAVLGGVFAAGRLVEPVLVGADDGVLGTSPRPRGAKAAETVVDGRVLPAMWRAMEEVTAEGGTAGHLDPTFPVAMKTGTGATTGVGYHVNYVGSGPLPQPKVAFAVRVTHEGSSPRVNAVAREVTGALFEALGRRYRAGQEAR